MASVISGYSYGGRPDKSLVVECSFDRSLRRIRFHSARNCSYILLKRKVEECFSIPSTSFIITYKDDDGSITDITSDDDLTEAITYFAFGSDDGPVSSNASSYSGRSSSSRKIMLRVDVVVDYEGPGLSDTGSLVSLEDYRRKNGSDVSLSLDNGDLRSFGRAIGQRDDDEATISSHPDPPPIRGGLPKRPTRQSGNYPPPSIGDLEGLPEESVDIDVRDNALRDSQIFEHLKLDPMQNLLPPIGMATEWVAQQNARGQAILGTGSQSEPSISDAPFDSLSASEGYDNIPPGEAEDVPGDLALQQDPKGKYYYTYRSSRASSLLSHSSDGHRRNPNRASMETNRGGSSAKAYSYRGSYSSFDSEGMMMGVLLGPIQPRDTRAPSPSNNNQSFQTIHPIIHIDDAASHPGIPSEVLPFLPTREPAEAVHDPNELTECSNCLTVLDSFRYVCATCGPRKPRIQVNGGIANSGMSEASDKGKGKAGTSLSASDYPSGSGTSIARTTSSPSSGWAMLDNAETHELVSIRSYPPGTHSHVNGYQSPHTHVQGHGHHSHHHPRRPLPPIPLSLNTGTPPGNQAPNQSPPAPPRSRPGSTVSSGSGSRISTASTLYTDTGFELCMSCMESGIGVDHAAESVLGAVVTPLTGTGSAFGSNASGYAGSQVSLESGSWRRATPKKKSQFRHAFIEQFWGSNGWTEVEQVDAEKCTTCGSLLKDSKYKCSTCENLILCKGCYSQVHEVHPIHAFLVSHKKEEEKAPPIEAIGRSATPPLVTQPQDQDEDELSMVHPGVKCFHCMQDIVGARFHCAICPSVDICSQCEAAGLPGNLTTTEDNGHESSHIMIKIPFPLQHDEVRMASRRAMHLWTGRDGPNIEKAPIMDNDLTGLEKKAIVSDYGGTVMGEKKEKGLMNGVTKGAGGPLDHRIPCNGCGKNIIGVRYQCAGCPARPGNLYSLCADCDAKSYALHDPTHSFFKIPRPVDRQIYSGEPLVPPLYIMDAGQSLEGTVNNNQDPRAYLQTIQHRSAVCDRCVERITGEWFRCVYCAKDLCEDCEALDSHDPTHFFIVFKSVVDTALLRSLTDTDVDESSAGRPLLSYNVYKKRV